MSTKPKTPDSHTGSHPGVHEAQPGEKVRSRSDDPGQSSYGGFSNEDPGKQVQQLDTDDTDSDANSEGDTGGDGGD